ncbi:MAG: NifB/NifX family molybdenum-iron cluster-binding protein [Phycisphaerae bacterium]|nr:NifB/NifX family molybdenum-iron cluster-binding protein [Phycisphaerae bacterium]
MKIVITAQGQDVSSPLDPRFGRAKWLVAVDTETGGFEVHDNTVNLNASSGAGIQTAQNVARLGAQAVITGNIGPNAVKTLDAANVAVFLSKASTVQEAVDAFKAGELSETRQANVEGHWV